MSNNMSNKRNLPKRKRPVSSDVYLRANNGFRCVQGGKEFADISRSIRVALGAEVPHPKQFEFLPPSPGRQQDLLLASKRTSPDLTEETWVKWIELFTAFWKKLIENNAATQNRLKSGEIPESEAEDITRALINSWRYYQSLMIQPNHLDNLGLSPMPDLLVDLIGVFNKEAERVSLYMNGLDEKLYLYSTGELDDSPETNYMYLESQDAIYELTLRSLSKMAQIIDCVLYLLTEKHTTSHSELAKATKKLERNLSPFIRLNSYEAAIIYVVSKCTFNPRLRTINKMIKETFCLKDKEPDQLRDILKKLKNLNILSLRPGHRDYSMNDRMREQFDKEIANRTIRLPPFKSGT